MYVYGRYTVLRSRAYSERADARTHLRSGGALSRTATPALTLTHSLTHSLADTSLSRTALDYPLLLSDRPSGCQRRPRYSVAYAGRREGGRSESTDRQTGQERWARGRRAVPLCTTKQRFTKDKLETLP